MSCSEDLVRRFSDDGSWRRAGCDLGRRGIVVFRKALPKQTEPDRFPFVQVRPLSKREQVLTGGSARCYLIKWFSLRLPSREYWRLRKDKAGERGTIALTV